MNKPSNNPLANMRCAQCNSSRFATISIDGGNTHQSQCCQCGKLVRSWQKKSNGTHVKGVSK